MKHALLALALVIAPSVAIAQRTTTVTCDPLDTLVITRTALSASLRCTLKSPLVIPPVTPPAVPPITSGEPVYTPGVGTLVAQDNLDRYTSTTQMGAFPYAFAGPMLAPNPAPSQTSQPVDTQHVKLIVGRGNTGKALRLAYDGIYQESHNVAVINVPAQPDNQTVVLTYWARVTPASTWPLSQPLAVKWIEAWHNHSQNTRLQFNTRYPSSSNTKQTAKTVWQVIDQAESATNGDQPLGPYFQNLADSQWHRYTHAIRPHTSAAVRDGFAKMWIDGVLVIDVEQAAVGVIPAGGLSAWCSQIDVNNLSIADGVSFFRWGGPQTTNTGAWTFDIDDITWSRQ